MLQFCFCNFFPLSILIFSFFFLSNIDILYIVYICNTWCMKRRGIYNVKRRIKINQCFNLFRASQDNLHQNCIWRIQAQVYYYQINMFWPYSFPQFPVTLPSLFIPSAPTNTLKPFLHWLYPLKNNFKVLALISCYLFFLFLFLMYCFFSLAFSFPHLSHLDYLSVAVYHSFYESVKNVISLRQVLMYIIDTKLSLEMLVNW